MASVEDLNDPRRPTALVGQWTSLFRCGEYWTAYEKISSTKGEHWAASTLYRVCQVVYESTKAYVNDLTRTLESVVGHLYQSGTLPTEGKEIERLLPHQDERESFLDSLRTLYSRSKTDDASGKPKARKLVVELLKSKSPPASVTEMVDEVLRSEMDFDLGPVKKFTDQLVQLIYYMRSQDVPLMVDLAAVEGATFDLSLYDVEGSTAAAEPRSLVIKSVIRPAVLRNEPGPVLSKGDAEVMSRSQSQAKQGVIGSSPSDITVKPEDPPTKAECKDEIDHSHEKTFDISYCANMPLPLSDDEDLHEDSGTEALEEKEDAEVEAKKTMLYTDGTRSPASLFSTQTSSTTSRQTCKTGPLVTPTTEPLLDPNGIKGSSTGPEDPAETTPKKHCCLRSHDMNPEGDVEQTKNETASPSSDESVDPTSELGTISEERESHNRSTEPETQDESSNRSSDSSMAAGRNQRATHDQNVEVPREKYQETEKQLAMQSADEDCSDQEISHSKTSAE